jgi:alpha-glucosidase
MSHLRTPAPLLVASLLLAAAASAQVLARPGWAGSGVTVETWWQRAVFYRLDPATFQDSNGDGRGDLGGVAQRMDYLQSLGVDAIILAPAASSPPLSPADMSDGFDDLVRQASLHHVRVLVALDVSCLQPVSGGNGLLAAARSWLTQGAAGFFMESSLLADPQFSADLLHQLRSLTATFPGERVLLSAPLPAENAALQPALRREVQLIATPPLAGGDALPTAATLRSQVTASLGSAPAASSPRSRAGLSGLPLLAAARNLPAPDDRQRDLLQRDLAVLTLASRSAVLLDYGEELGLDPAAVNAPLMQWTPSNRTVAPKPPPEIPASSDAVEYKAYTPYIAPLPRSLNPPPPQLPAAFVSEKPDPLTLPGFSAVSPDASLSALASPNGATANVVTEDADANSLLNLYRHLIQLHHQDPTLYDGAQLFLDHDADDVLVWIRRPTPGARISTTVLAVCNLADHNLHLDLDSELRMLRAPHGGLRTLASGSPVPFQDSEDIVLPAGGAFLGEFSR